ncbi:MAG: serine/threonine-protein kinase [Gemmatimonadaceae bacterium]
MERSETASRQVETRMHPVTLNFEPGLEREFRVEYHERTLPVVRLALVLGILLYSIFGILDALIAPDQRYDLWLIRFAFVVPAMAGTLAFTWADSFQRFREPVLFVSMLFAALGIVAMTAIIPRPGSYLYYAGLLLAVMYAFSLLRLRLVSATAATLATIVSYVVTAVWINPTPAALVVNNLFFLLSAFIIAFAAQYAIERYARTNFLQRRLIASRTEELERTNAELESRNVALAESRAETVRAAQRSELIYSALSEALPGKVLDEKYRVEGKLGSGSFGTVYRGIHLHLNHPVAIKVFRPTVGSGAAETLDRFRLEGITACRITHPNAVAVLDFDVAGGSLAYMVMELLEGRSLAEELEEVGKLPVERCRRIAAEVCDVLAAAHEAGLVHRDVKPSNVFLHHVKGDEQVKVIDFGIAKLMDADAVLLDSAGARRTATGVLVGTPAYMAPERLNSEPYDGRADVYAVGVLLYEMLTGTLPFTSKGTGNWSFAMMIGLTEAPAPSSVEPGVPPGLDDIVRRALSKSPAARPSAAELAMLLRGENPSIPLPAAQAQVRATT